MLPLIRLSQQSSPAVIKGVSSPGDWAMLYPDEIINLGRFKGLLLDQRQFFWKWIDDERRYEVVRPGATLIGDGWRNGTEYLVWMPHYKTLGVVCVTALNGRIRGCMDFGALYGFSSERINLSPAWGGPASFLIPVVRELDLNVSMPSLSILDESRYNFAKGLDVCPVVC